MDHNHHWMSGAGESGGYLGGYMPPHHDYSYTYHPHHESPQFHGPIGHHSHLTSHHQLSGIGQGMTPGMFHHQDQFSASLTGLPGSGAYPASPPASTPSKRKRKRVVTPIQRTAANVRERKRMYNLNEAFDSLRKKVPTFAYEKRLSRIETLRLAITYISFLGDVVEGKDPDNVDLPKSGQSALDTIQRLLAQSEQCSDSDSRSSGDDSPPRHVIPYASM